ncbi:hypothetical protein SB57_04310 [Lactobacillus delbrueckii subsp. bulgaricus]|nr:hypothetical protein SB57_04310 [Lactobacillus delbrueckii subsp. bulgaricus]
MLEADASVIGRAKLNLVILPGLNAVARYVVDHNLLVNSLNSSCLGGRSLGAGGNRCDQSQGH